MKDFKKIIIDLKLHLANGKNIKILDKDIANLLIINQARFATIKKRNVTPYEEILLYCEREKRDSNRVFFSQE